MNKKTTKNLITLLALAFVIGGANMASAYVPGVWEPQPHINSNEPAFTKIPMPYDEPIVAQISPKTFLANNSTTTKKTTTTTTKNTTVSNTKTTNSNTSEDNLARELKPEMKPINDSNNELTALSFRGSGSFMPSSIWQWFVVILLILAIILIARMISRSSHTVHTVSH